MFQVVIAAENVKLHYEKIMNNIQQQPPCPPWKEATIEHIAHQGRVFLFTQSTQQSTQIADLDDDRS